jgi:Icc-related predicted phosphoesterase
MSRRVTRVLCAAEPRGDGGAIERLCHVASEQDAQVMAIVGDLTSGDSATEGLRTVFKALGKGGIPSYWVPGPGDAPIAGYLREAHNMEVVFPMLHGIHGTAAFTPDGHVVVAGMGGGISDDPEAPRDEEERLTYPRWEAEYRLKLVSELDEHQRMLLFHSPPAHKGDDGAAHGGSEAVAELIATLRPRLVVCGGPQRTELIGRSLVVAPGSLAEDGAYAIADMHTREVETNTISVTA